MNAHAPHPRDWRPEDRITRPDWWWWPAILGGLALLFAQGHSEAVYQWWTTHMHPLPSAQIWRWVFYGAIPIHIFRTQISPGKGK